jgi:hypothetical protein
VFVFERDNFATATMPFNRFSAAFSRNAAAIQTSAAAPASGLDWK